MILIEAIHIEEFRGIRKLDLKPDGKSLVICGPNGSGKSGVVDAIDFGLTGNIARLSGAGTGGLSVLRHGPHVAKRDDPGAAKVQLALRDPASGKTAVLTRTVTNPGIYALVPDVPEVRAAVDRAHEHPELTLSRRQIIDYVLAEPSARAKKVQALLKLDRLGDIRSLLRTAQSKSSAAENAKQGEVTSAEDSLRRHLDLPALIVLQILEAVNKRRAVLGLAPIEVLGADMDLTGGLTHEGQQSPLDKPSAIRDLAAVIELSGADVRVVVGEVLGALDELSHDPTVLELIHQRALVEAGITRIRDHLCPLCDMEWNDEASLRAHLVEKLQRSDAAAALHERILRTADAVRAQSSALRSAISTVTQHATRLGLVTTNEGLMSWSAELSGLEATLTTIEGVATARPSLTDHVLAAPATALAAIDALKAGIEGVPDQSAAEEARAFLLLAQDRWKRVGDARRGRDRASLAQKAASAVYGTYCATMDAALNKLYETVQDDLGAHYRFINADDESTFKAELTPSAGKLDLDVDFYGQGMFPPGAYHSEGHQDGMGVCLYLALMRQLLGSDFRFAVLDDVVMSVDRGHRKRFCELLRAEFPEVQFVITTHEDTWARQMQSAGLISTKNRVQFRAWSVENGPDYETGGDIWPRIEADLAKDDLPGAAHKLRRHLEQMLTEIADAIGAKVHFRADGRYDYGELYGAVNGRYGDLLQTARKAATSWGRADEATQIEALKVARSEACAEQGKESWAVNLLVHYNADTEVSKEDFASVVDAGKKFIEVFYCSNSECESVLRLVGAPGKEEALRCDCASVNLNLKTR